MVTRSALEEAVGDALSNLPFPVRITSECDDSTWEMKVWAQAEYKHKVYIAGFKISYAEFNTGNVLDIKANALRKMLERSWAKIISNDFSFNVEYELRTAIEDAVAELREVE